jgi:WD40 repeat protein
MLRIWTFDAPWVPGSLQPTASMPLLAKASGAPITQQNLSRVGMIARIEDVKYPLLSNDGRYLAWSSLSALYSTDDRSTIYLMEVSSGTVTQIDGYAPVAFLADGSSLITLDQGRSRLMEWNLQGGLRLVKTHACGDCGSRNAVSPDGVTAVATNQTGRDIAVELRRLNGNAIENQAVQLLGEPIDEGLFRWAESFQFSPQGNLLAIIFNDGIAEIWRWKENRLLHTIDIKQRAIAWVAFSADEQTIWYSYVKINVSSMENYAGFDRWQSDSAGTLSLVQEFNLPDEQPFNYAYGLDLSPKLGLLAASEENGIIILWDVNKGQKLGSLESGEGIRSLIRFSPDGSLLLTLDQDGVLELWGVPSP